MFAHLRRNAVSAVDDALAIWNFIFAVDEDGALAAQFIHDKAVVDNLFADVDRRTKGLERDADYINCPHHPGTEPSRLQQKHGLSLAVWQSQAPDSYNLLIIPELCKMQKSARNHYG